MKYKTTYAIVALFMLAAVGVIMYINHDTEVNGSAAIDSQETSVGSVATASPIGSTSLAPTAKNRQVSVKEAKTNNATIRHHGRGAIKLLQSTGNEPGARLVAVKEISVFCSAYFASKTDFTVTVEPKVAAWCDGVENYVTPSELYAHTSNALSPVQSEVNRLIQGNSSPKEIAKVSTKLLRQSTTPGDMAVVAGLINQYNSAALYSGTGVASSDPRADVFAHFAGIAAACSEHYCGPMAEGTMLVCTWPGFTCAPSDDFEEALLKNFSVNDTQKIRLLSKRLRQLARKG